MCTNFIMSLLLLLLLLLLLQTFEWLLCLLNASDDFILYWLIIFVCLLFLQTSQLLSKYPTPHCVTCIVHLL
jgi:hypothetical protein